jgi:hypothetical protein
MLLEEGEEVEEEQVAVFLWIHWDSSVAKQFGEALVIVWRSSSYSSWRRWKNIAHLHMNWPLGFIVNSSSAGKES